MGELVSLQDYQKRRAAPPPPPPDRWAWLQARDSAGTRTLIAASAVVALGQVLARWANGGPTVEAVGGVLRGGAVARPWTLLSAPLLAVGPVHLAAVGLVLWSLGRQAEAIYGRGRLLILTLGAALGGALWAAALGGPGLHLGAAGLAWGLLGALGVQVLRRPDQIPWLDPLRLRRPLAGNLLFCVLATALPGTSLAMALGGLVTGAALIGTGAVRPAMSADYTPQPLSAAGRRLAIGLAGLTGLCVVLAFGLGFTPPR